MPVRPENLGRYPVNWPAISRRIRFSRAAGRCECLGECGRSHRGRCPNRHGQPAYDSGTDVVLSTAHLVSATHLPMDLHVTRATHTGEVVQLVGILMPFNPERLERDDVVHRRALSEFLAGPSASSARFVVALPGGTTRGLPGGPVVAGMATRPEWVILSGWSLSRPPGQAADVSTEAASRPQVVAGDSVLGSAPLAGSRAKRPLGTAHQFSATGLRASSDVIRSLLRRDRDYLSTDGALNAALAPALCSSDAGALDAYSLLGRELEPALGRTGQPVPLGVMREVIPAGRAGLVTGTQTWSGHPRFYHFGYLPENCTDANLRALCQGCHLAYDREHHRQTAAATRRQAIEDAGQLTIDI